MSGRADCQMDTGAYLIFSLEGQFYGISVTPVKHVIRAVMPTYLKDAPELLVGLINMGGDIIPVIDIRKQLGMPDKSISISDRVIIAESSGYNIAFYAEAVTGVMELSPRACTPPDYIFPEMKRYIRGVARINRLTILIYDINTLFPDQVIRDMADKINKIKDRT